MLTDKRMKLRSQIMRKRLLILLMLQMVIMLLMMMMTTMMMMVMTMMVMRCATSENICYNLQMKWLAARSRGSHFASLSFPPCAFFVSFF